MFTLRALLHWVPDLSATDEPFKTWLRARPEPGVFWSTAKWQRWKRWKKVSCIRTLIFLINRKKNSKYVILIIPSARIKSRLNTLLHVSLGVGYNKLKASLAIRPIQGPLAVTLFTFHTTDCKGCRFQLSSATFYILSWSPISFLSSHSLVRASWYLRPEIYLFLPNVHVRYIF